MGLLVVKIKDTIDAGEESITQNRKRAGSFDA